MGIKTLLPFLKNVTEESNLENFQDLIAAVDASCWLHKAISISFSRFGDDRRVKEICSSYLDLLHSKKIRLLVVFDGLSLPGKEREREQRARQREKQTERAEQLQRSGNFLEARKALAAAAEIDHDLVCGFIETCRQKSIDYVVAPYEADAQIAYLMKHGYADIAISEDSDLLAYGCQTVLFKLQLNGACQVIKVEKALAHLSMSQDAFLNMCIAAGCDYLQNVRGIGIHKAQKLVTEDNDFLATLQNNRFAPTEYTVGFQTAKAIFLHQTVVNPVDAATTPLTPWGETPDVDAFLTSCGIIISLLSSEYTVNLAVGNVDPKNKTIRNMFPLPNKEGLWQPRDLTITVESMEHCNINWTVPELPVLTIEFLKTTVQNRRTTTPALFKAGDKERVKAGDKIICTKWCDLKFDNITYLVLWEFRQSEPLQLTDNLIPDAGDAHNSSGDEDTDDAEYTVPFKVLGVAYKGRQTHLKKAYEHLENAQEVTAKLQPEPDNDYDQNAIAVLINFGSGWHKVGYIAKELTSELHPLIDTIIVNVARIRFRVNYLQVGFYITLSISKKGPWSKKLVKASKKAK